MATSKDPPQRPAQDQQIWWSNAVLFIGVHVVACMGVCCHPFRSTPKATLALAVVCWQAACFSITIGYHRLYSHRSFEAGLKSRAFLALLGTSAFQGSIKWWVLRHRLHHRYTDDPVHDPYSATRGLLWSHMGWIFFKQHYNRMAQIDREDLDEDPVVRLQHEYYVPLALFTALLLPTFIGALWHDAMGAFIWAGLVARIAVWHCTFLVNSLAHWDGVQPYSDENSSRVNFIVALFTCGEGNHNFHAFPQDFRSGPSMFDWDPSKWIILLLHQLGLARALRRARDEDLARARWRMHFKTHVVSDVSMDSESSEAEVEMMSAAEVCAYVEGVEGRCMLIVDEMVVDVTAYMVEHPGGATLLRKYCIKPEAILYGSSEEYVKDLREKATSAFHGGMNKHSLVAHDRLRELTIAHLGDY